MSGGLIQLVSVAIVDRNIEVQPLIRASRPLGFLERVFGRNQNEHID